MTTDIPDELVDKALAAIAPNGNRSVVRHALAAVADDIRADTLRKVEEWFSNISLDDLAVTEYGFELAEVAS